MSRDDLLELAALDAFGLLDDYEAALFTRSFHHAPAGVQDEIRDLQADFAGDEALLPEVSPDATLKTRVLRSVATAIEDESVELAPLATIGRRRSAPRDAIARIGRGSSGSYWRAASFVLAAVSVLFAYFGAQARVRNNQLWDYVINRNSAEIVEKLAGRDYVALAEDKRSLRVLLQPVDPAQTDATAYVIVREGTNPDTDAIEVTALLKTDFLEPGDYTLTARNADGDVIVDRAVAPTLAAAGYLPLDLGARAAAQFAALTWELTDTTGQVILTSSV